MAKEDSYVKHGCRIVDYAMVEEEKEGNKSQKRMSAEPYEDDLVCVYRPIWFPTVLEIVVVLVELRRLVV